MTTLDARALNRARLHRQWLTGPREATPLEVMEHLVGMQAQQGDAPYYQLWSRLRGFAPNDLSAALTDRHAVRVVLMRGTIHLVSARDCLALRPVIQPFLDKTLLSGSQSGKRIVGVDIAELIAEGTKLLEPVPLHVDELAAGLAKRFPDYDGVDLAYGLRCAMPLIQTPPRGVWGRGGGLTYASTRQWLGTEFGAEPDVDDVIRRYLTAFGPATIQDFQVWSSLTHMKPFFERLRDRLIVHQDAQGHELFDVPGVELPEAGGMLPPLLLGPFDNIFLSHQDREFVISKAAQNKVFTRNGIVKGTVLIDGFVHGSWKTTLKRKTALLEIDTFEALSANDREYLEAEGLRLLGFAATAAESHTVEFVAQP